MSFEMQDLVDRLYAALGTPVTLTDRQDRMLAYSSQPLDKTDKVRQQSVLGRHSDEATRPVNDFARHVQSTTRLPADPAAGRLERVIVPLRTQGHIAGLLYLIDPDRRVTDEALERFADEFEAVARQIELVRMPRSTSQAAVRSLLSTNADERQIAVEELKGCLGSPADRPSRTVVLAPPGRDHSMPFWSRVFGARSPWSEIDGLYVYLVTEDLDPDGVASRVRFAGGSGAVSGVAIGIGGSSPGLAEAYLSYRTALRALQLAKSGLTGSNVAAWDTMGSWRTLLSLDRSAAEASIDPRVRLLVASEDGTLLRMLRSYLEREKDNDELATEFHMHRTTLYARFRRLQDKYGLSWEHPEDRLATILGLRITLLYAGS
ncbi:PucR family transcriptional regulator [Arthrobacter mobilis]|uniref:PucR C-terminal helix-turn-helix domain-containing protein n=1 Tax=Arthrobacter mobilis TaxID=2724944 RepID=A0A7X6K7H8_9MICC|nr:helix-turn-helix domain-containing protein [Arthrobacter mobilis]NKX56556.1 hypothetical protein [Arthrobacter mobilis]